MPILHFNGSFGDLFFIASCIAGCNDIGRRYRIVAAEGWRSLLRVFMGRWFVDNKVEFVNARKNVEIRNEVLNKWRKYRWELTDISREGIPADAIMTPLMCDYPHLSILYNSGRLSYIEAVALMLGYDHREIRPKLPYWLEQKDREQVITCVGKIGLNRKEKTCLYHPINQTNKGLPKERIKELVKRLDILGIEVVLNVAGGSDEIKAYYKSFSKCIDVPAHILPLVQSRFECVAGITGGALCIALEFSKTKVISVVTKDIQQANITEKYIGKDQMKRFHSEKFGFHFFGDEISSQHEIIDGRRLNDDELVHKMAENILRKGAQ